MSGAAVDDFDGQVGNLPYDKARENAVDFERSPRRFVVLAGET